MTLTAAPTHDLAARGQHYSQFLKLVEDQSSRLHQKEQEILREAADALLFNEENGEEVKQSALELLSDLQEKREWSEALVRETTRLLLGCGGQTSAPA